MTDLGRLCERVYKKIEWQKFPVEFSTKDKEMMILDAIIHAIEDLFVVTGRAMEYSSYEYIYETESNTGTDGESDSESGNEIDDETGLETDTNDGEDERRIPSEFTYTLLLDEELYVICAAQIEIFDKVRAQYNDLLGYTTNALTVTNADKPYAYVTGTIHELEDYKRRYYYKMVRFAHL